MAISTTQSIWRSGGGDQTRAAYCGTPVMVAQFYVADAGPAATANVTVSSVSGAPALLLPANAVVTNITITAAGTATNSATVLVLSVSSMAALGTGIRTK